MTPQQLLGVGVRLFAVWLALKSIPYLAIYPDALSSQASYSQHGGGLSYAIGIGYLVVAIALWLVPMVVAHKLLPRTHHTNNLQIAAYDLARVGIGLLGLWLLSQALPSIVGLVFRSLLVIDAGSAFSSMSSDDKLSLVVNFSELIIGTLLTFRSATFARLLVPPRSSNDSR